MEESKRIKVQTSFHRSTSQSVYLRDKEKERINEFLDSSESILHICGRPGTGKTLTIKSALAQKKYLYTNSYTDSELILSFTKNKNYKLFVIDEFDIFENKYKKESKKITEFIKKGKKKLITISNYLGSNENVLIFKPYSAKEIEEIILQKFKNEIQENILSPIKIKILAKKCNDGDLRAAFDSVIKEINEDKEKIANNETNIHKEIIREIISATKRKNKSQMYEDYLKKCKFLNLVAYERSDFTGLCDLCE